LIGQKKELSPDLSLSFVVAVLSCSLLISAMHSVSVGLRVFFLFLTDIMTVTVVLSEGKMSLFQDLKLKRRKVDSRCSSDGKVQHETQPSGVADLSFAPRR
jgi:hypothetical protein